MSEKSEEDKTLEEHKEEVSAEKEQPQAAEPQEVNYKEKYLRLLAEQENMRKRMQKEKQDTVRFAIENAIGEFLPSIDNFENALKFAENTSEEVRNWAAGFQMILSQFKDVLHNHGVVAYHSEGNTFDPHYHEAVEIFETDEHPDGTIVQEFAKGYKSASRTLRPARVKVAKEPKEQVCEEEKATQEK